MAILENIERKTRKTFAFVLDFVIRGKQPKCGLLGCLLPSAGNCAHVLALFHGEGVGGGGAVQQGAWVRAGDTPGVRHSYGVLANSVVTLHDRQQTLTNLS